MGSHIVDSVFLKDLFGTAEMRKVFADENLLQKWLDVEASLARAEAKLGIIPEAAAAEISRKAFSRFMDTAQIKEQIDITCHPIVPLIRALQKACDGDAGEYTHWGATTQDIMDTGIVLQIKEAFEIIFRDLRELEEILLNLAERYKDTVMAGRTHGQHALPITFGFKVAVWTSEVQRHIERLKECRKRLFVGEFAGATGTLASLGEAGLKVQSLMMDDLGLGVPDIAWFTSRDRFAEFTGILAMIGSTFAKIANEVATLQKTEVDELEEPFSKGKVGSSTMPHKRNPMISEGIVALAKIVRADLPLAIEGMINEHERDMRSWQAEWEYIAEICILTGSILQQSKRLISGLVVKPENMKRNLSVTGGLICSEAVMLELARKMGRLAAHELVYELSMKAFEQNVPFKKCLLESPEVTKYLNEERINYLLDPANYIGLSALFVEKVVKSVKAARENQ